MAILLKEERTKSWTLTVRSLFATPAALAKTALLVLGVTILVHFILETDQPIWSLLKIIFPVHSLGVFPGLLLFLYFFPQQSVTIFEALAGAVSLNFVLIQMTMFFCILCRLPCWMATILLCSFSVILGIALIAKPRSCQSVVFEKEEMLLTLLITPLALLVYLKGSTLAGEDSIFVSIIRRLAALPRLDMNQINYVPGMLYQYPFQGLLFFHALVSNFGNIDPLFVYDKMRPFWCILANIAVYLSTRKILKSNGIALFVSAVALLFAYNGTFANVKDMFWGQLTPVSHLSDFAMNVALPLLMTVSFYYFSTVSREETFFWGVLIGCWVFLFPFIHPRELVQCVVYLGSFLLALILLRQRGPYFKRTMVVLGCSALWMWSYATFHQHLVPYHHDYNAASLKQLDDIVKEFTIADYFREPLLKDHYFMQAFGALFYGWIPIVLCAAPVIYFFLSGYSLMHLVGMSILIYLLVIRFPFLSIPYIRLTYNEILFVPARNIMFFVYPLTGLLFYFIATALARIRFRILGFVLAACFILGLKIIWPRTELFFEHHRDVLFGTVFGLFILVFALLCIRKALTPYKWNDRVPGRKLFAVLLLLPIVIITANRFSTPLNLTSGRISLTPVAMRRDLPPITAQFHYPPDGVKIDVIIPATKAMPPSEALLHWMQNHLQTNDILVANGFNAYSLSIFAPQLILVWPVLAEGHVRAFLFPKYYEFYNRSVERYGTQPFFNSKESLEERLEFLNEFHATHVVIDPMYDDEMTRVLNRWPEIFTRLYAEGKWSIYKIQYPKK